MTWFCCRNFYFIAFTILLIVYFGGLNLSPSFFLFQESQAEILQIFGLSEAFASGSFNPWVEVWPLPQETATGTADSTEGGELVLSTEGGCVVSISFPAGAVTASADISIGSMSEASIATIASAPSDLNIVSDLVYDFVVKINDQTITTFDQPVTLTFAYTNTQISGLDESTIRVYYWDRTEKNWVLLSDYTLDTANNTINVTISHFTLFAIMSSLPPSPVCGNGTVEDGEQCDDGNTTSGDGCSSTCQTEVPAGGGGGGGGGGSVYIPPSTETKVIIQGKAYPDSSVVVLKDGKIVGTVVADPQANFKKVISDITPGTYTFGVWAEDKKGRKSITFSFTTLIRPETITTIGGIFIPPTIELSKVGLQRGEILNILGQTVPESEVSIFINSSEEIVKKTEAEKDGNWFYAFDTTLLEDGSHTSRAKAISPDDLVSTYSRTLSFYIGEGVEQDLCPGADFNKDGRVNLIDFSILLYWWKKDNTCCDQNQDGIVNIIDFSILLYYWTG